VDTGLGLAIVKGLVEAHAGTVALVDPDRGGASFRFTLPLAELMPRVLIVEDDVPLRNAVRGTLESSGYEARMAGDGAAGSRALAEERYEVVLLDIGLPFVDGRRVLEGLEPGRLPAVIVISARGEERDKVRALDLGADDYLAKPFGADEPLARIRAGAPARPPWRPPRFAWVTCWSTWLGAPCRRLGSRSGSPPPSTGSSPSWPSGRGGGPPDAPPRGLGPVPRPRAELPLDLRAAAAAEAGGRSPAPAGDRQRRQPGLPPGLTHGRPALRRRRGAGRPGTPRNRRSGPGCRPG
jgi:CheY-like chemotaxis protein